MSITQAAPDTDGVWREKRTPFGGAGARPLDGLPAAAGAWWPGWQLFTSYAGALVSNENADGTPVADVGAGTTGQVLGATIAAAGATQSQFASQLLDQSGHAKPLTAAAVASAPKLYDQASLRFVQQNLSLALGYIAAARAMLRNDALGLAADPALTIAVKLKFDTITPPALAPNILALGDAVSPELCLFGNTVAGPTDVIGLSDFDGFHGAQWVLAAGTIAQLHSYVVTKPAASGYDVTGWKLYIDGVDQGAPVALGAPSALVLGSALTQLGDVPGGGFPYLGTLAGCIVWPSVLTTPQLAQLQAFLDSV